MKEYHILNLGAGVQSTVAALLAGKVPQIPLFDFAIFADTQEEPDAVYAHLQWLIKQLSYPVIIRTNGKLGDDLKHGKITARGERFASIPAFVKTNSINGGLTRRQCTRDYKTDVVARAIRQDVLRLAPRQRFHPTQKPLDVMLWALSQCEGASVLDPWMGSGTSLRAAKDLGKKATGIEIDERYCEIAAKRMSQEVLAL